MTVIFFLLIFGYLGIHIYRYASKERFPLYEVPKGELISQNQNFQGFILRDEICYTAPEDGCINYYIAAGRRASAGSTVYTLDKNGEFSQMILSSSGNGQNLSEEELEKIVQRMKNLQLTFDGMNFQDVYQARNAIAAAVMDSLTAAAVEALNETMGISGFIRIETERSGIVSLTSDRYDEWTQEQLTVSCLTPKDYSRSVSMAGEEKETGDFVYKIIPDDSFDVYFQMDPDEMARYGSDLNASVPISVSVYLEKIKQTVQAELMLAQTSDGETVCRLSFSKYGSNYVNDRYIDFAIQNEDTYGMKIPVSSVMQKEFFLISPEYVISQEGSSALGVSKQTESGETVFAVFDQYVAETQTTQLENGEEAEETVWYYVRAEELSIGDVLVSNDGATTTPIISTVPVDGVYEANQGYAEFKIVTILQTTEDNAYYLVSPKVRYGIAAYDYIVIDGSSVEEGQVLQ